MERFLKQKGNQGSSSKTPEFVELDGLPSDPADRKPISTYSVNQRDETRRTYLLRGPCQPSGVAFPYRMIGNDSRHFPVTWYTTFKGWLEYIIKDNRVYCLHCYLFKDQVKNLQEAFISEGFNGWNRQDKVQCHQGEFNSLHNKAFKLGEDLLNQDQSIQTFVDKKSEKEKSSYRLRLGASSSLAKRLVKLGAPFRGHDESKDSLNKGLFLEILELMREQNEELGKVILGNAPENSQMTSPTFQQDLKHYFAQEVLKQIFEDLGEDYFSLLVNESCGVSNKEQMSVVIRYVYKYGVVKERFIGLIHVLETSVLTLKSTIDDLFSRNVLSMGKIRGQGYDGANVTNSLSQCLQRKEQDLVNASSLVYSTKRQLEYFRSEGYNKFVEKAISFCENMIF
ncbi:uncharacterized protein LOC143613426 [Bidens hawaiensis]|uniref:uncharacterized protein LOC143613426 n=1 Tax=Bidens hawaiensis TaxID=980011 RepID=UPI00404AE01F